LPKGRNITGAPGSCQLSYRFPLEHSPRVSNNVAPFTEKDSRHMQVNHDFDIHIHRIKSYGKGEVTITLPFEPGVAQTTEGDEAPKGVQIEKLSHSTIILPKQLVRAWSPRTVAELAREHIQQLAALKPEVAIIGTGRRLQWPNRALLTPLMEAGIGFEIMDTAAACRTYNILSYEGRVVAAALMMIEE